MNTQTIDTNKLHELYSTSEEAKAILNIFAKRIKARKQTTVDSMVAETSQPRAQIIQVLHELQNVGCGTFKAGRRGFVSRFEWDVNLADVGKAAQGTATTVQPLVAPDDTAEETETAKPTVTVKRKRGRPLGSRNHIALSPVMRQRFALRPNFMVGLTLPRDLTQTEAKKIGDYVHLIAQEG